MVDLGTLNIVTVWLNPSHLVSTAKILMEGHKISAIGVVDTDQKLLGVVTKANLQLTPDYMTLQAATLPTTATIQKSLSVRDAANIVIEQEADFLPVLDGEKFYGILTTRNLIGKLRESWDPMTSLPWSDALRDWGVNQLQKGVEIAILFVDLNEFGKFNKAYGHVVGDRVLQKVAEHLKSHCNSETDIVVRYGGDEFAIGTTRDYEEAEALIKTLLADGSGLKIPETNQAIHFSVGIGGGRRSNVRQDLHEPSNVDDLVNMASQSCLAKKSGTPTPDPKPMATPPAVPSIPAPVAAPKPTGLPKILPTIETIQVEQDPNGLTYVVLKFDDVLRVGVSIRMGRTQAESVAAATAKAIEKQYPGTSMSIEKVEVTRAGSTELIQIQCRTVREGFEREVTAEVEANNDLHESVAAGVISAYFAE